MKDLVLVMIGSFLFMACPMLTTPLITGYAKTLGASGAIMGLAGGLMNLCSMICRPFAGNIADLQSKYKLSFVGAAIMLVACVMYALSTNMTVVLIARIVNGIGFSLCSVAMSTWIALMLPPEKLGAGMGLYGTMNAMSMAIAPAIGIKIQAAIGYQAAFYVAAGFALGLIIIVQFTTNKGVVNYTAKEKEKREAQIKIVEPKVIPIAILITLFTIPYFATQSFIVEYVQERSFPVLVGGFFTIYAAAVLILRLALSKYFDRLPYKYFVFASSASALLGMICLWMLKNNLVMVAAAVFMAGGYGIMCSVSQANAMLKVEKDKKGLANSTYYLGLDIGMASGPMIGGLIYEHIDISMFYPVLMITVPLILVVYTICRKNLGSRKKD